MRHTSTLVLLLVYLFASETLAVPASTTPHIKVDQFGYLESMRKVAVIVDPQVGFNAAEAFSPGIGTSEYQVRRCADDVVVFSGTLQAWKTGATHAQSGDRGWYFDFTALTTPGSYYIWDTVNRVGSGRFEIGPQVYDSTLKQAVRTFYYQRLNMEKVQPYAGANWQDDAAYEGPDQDRNATSRWAKGDSRTARDLHGGWMDAGDTNKYVTFAESAVIQLLEAYRMNPAVFGDNFGIPESGNGVSDLLDEVKWELDFLQRMQDATATGGLFLKVGADNYDGQASPPSSDTRARYYLPECTSSTLAGSAMFAAAGLLFRDIDALANYGNGLLNRAQSAWSRAKTTTENFTSFETDCDDGDIKSGDADADADAQLSSALIAAIYLYEATGNTEYRVFVEENYIWLPPYGIYWWGPYWATTQVALLRFADLPGVTPSVASSILSQKAAQDDVMSIQDYAAGTDLYRAYLPDSQYHWGHNQVRANAGNLNIDYITFGINPENSNLYREVAEAHLHWLHGVNPLGLVMLSNMGSFGAESSANEIYHAWFDDGTDWDNAEYSPFGPAPGYVTGGPNKYYSGPLPGIADQPPQKAYMDWNGPWDEVPWEITEPAIYTQAAYVQLLARLMNTSPNGGPDTQPPSPPKSLTSSGITSTGAVVSWIAATDNVGVIGYNLYAGDQILVSNLAGTNATLTNLFCGTTYLLTLKAFDAARNISPPSNSMTFMTLACPKSNTIAYSDKLESGWTNWSWDATINFSNSSPVKVGKRSLRANFAAWGGLSLRHTSGIPVSPTSTLSFWAYSPVATSLDVSGPSQDTGDSSPVTITLRAKTWTSIALTKMQLGNPNLIKRLKIQVLSNQPTTVYFDQIQITR